ncbi:MAG: antibiotic biosynthesis monooxygenase [Chloroflexota bacterium]|jgi:hypothetical protein|nr:antibiotic biosynthesis monooxygenase [Chloroflexota bacterium]MDP6507651.1 antibiotic biosynthesis monooxygenase [Chloroflexota bacterium]|tara:strand:+ start:286 stop:597 length:312 start_codon:yes stop_codon:yes gene_type:complete
MILRLVGLPVEPGQVAEMERAFAMARPRIAALPGCQQVSLLRTGEGEEPDFLTLSVWDGRDDLEEYRRSDLFREIWPAIRATLRDKPWAKTYDYVAEDGAEAE